jgi:hypothetical protein
LTHSFRKEAGPEVILQTGVAWKKARAREACKKALTHSGRKEAGPVEIPHPWVAWKNDRAREA